MSAPRVTRAGWVAGVALVLVVAYVAAHALRTTDGVSSRGLQADERLPPFAAPLAVSALEGDVNVARGAGEGQAGKRPACAVRGPEVLNVCELYERGPVVLAFLATGGKQCLRELDALQRVRGRHPGVQVAAVAIRGDRDELRNTIRRRRWGFPVAYDRDGILATLYGVAVCPQVTYALPGGRVQGTSVGELGAGALDARIGELERAARAKGWRP